jgi:glycosyltransferase involved in cell wall biosynthesis
MKQKKMSTDPSVSVAMATFNGEQFIREQLDSIAVQSLLPKELVVTDDGSNPQTLDIIRKFQAQAPFPVRIHENNSRLGYRANFFKAFSLCTSELIVPCDQDDVWMPNKLERLSAAFTDEDVLLAMHRVRFVDSNLQIIPGALHKRGYYEGTYSPLTTDPYYLAYGMSLMIRRDLLTWLNPSEAGSFGHYYGHDTWLWFVATSLGKIVGLPEELTLYRQHAANVFGATLPDSLKKQFSVARRTGAANYIVNGAMYLELASKLTHIHPDAPERIKRRAQDASDHYKKRAMFFQRRAGLYGKTNRNQRIGTVIELLKSGAYRPIDSQGLGRKAFLKDVAISLIKNEQIA